MERLDSVAAGRFMYIHAPAGYGKTFSVRMWLSRRKGPGAWLAISESAGKNPGKFCKRLVMALLTIQSGNVELKSLVSQNTFASAPFEFLESALISFGLYSRENTEGNERGEAILVLDDLHLLTDCEVLKRLPTFIEELSEFVSLCFLSRAEPPDCFSEFVVKEQITVIGGEEFRFTPSEIKEFFALRGRTMSEYQAQKTCEETGGWAIGLNALMLSGREKTGRKMISSYLETFIREQIWDKWSPERRSFLLCVSVEDELKPAFCNYMSGRKDGEEVLNGLVRENAFISVDSAGVYRLHHLFVDFLRNTLDREDEKRKSEIYKKVGDWFYKNGDYFKAVEYYIKSKNKSGITKGLRKMYNYNSPYAAIEETLSIISLSVDESIVDEYPFLLEVQAWSSYVEGRGADMESYLDRYFAVLPKIIFQHPASAQTAVLLRCMDYRNSVREVAKGLKKLPLSLFGQSNTPSISQNMPYCHRSARDFSEYCNADDAEWKMLKKTVGVLVGEEYDLMERLIRGGLAYEKGELDTAYELASEANALLKDSFAPETQFCSYMLLATVLIAQGEESESRKILEDIGGMIRRHKAYYLNANFQAFVCRLKLDEGDVSVARDWLSNSNNTDSHGELSFYKLYRHFTTVRAYITSGEWNLAILFLKKLQNMCTRYRRTLDLIEVNILLAIAYWKKNRGNREEALNSLQSAIIISRENGFIQMFVNDGAELSNMLHKLLKRVIQKDYNGELTASEVKSLYYRALVKAKNSKGLTGGRTSQNLKFTEQQRKILHHLNDGLTHKEMAEKMGIKPSTIKSHMALIFKKLDVSCSVDAIVKIREHGLLDV